MSCIHMYCALQSLVTRNSHFQMNHILHMWNHPVDLYMEEEECHEVAGDWEEEYKLQREAGN